jgi:zinc transporter ZupT
MDILAIGSALSAGVILGAAFSHIAPDASGSFTEYFELANPEYAHADYPFSALTAIGVFFILICIDKLIVDPMLHHKHHHHKHEKSVADEAQQIELQAQSSPILQQPESEQEVREESPAKGASPPLSESENILEKRGHHHHGAQNHVALALEHFADGNDHDMHLKKLGTAYIFLIALSVHSIFDGLAVGSETDPNGFFGLMIAVVIHKLLDGFALGVPIFYARFSKLQTFLALAFCASMTPLGIGIGWIATAFVNGPSGVLTRAIFLSMSLGSFVYIGLIELLPAGLESPRYMPYKISLAIGGWGLMALLALWV